MPRVYDYVKNVGKFKTHTALESIHFGQNELSDDDYKREQVLASPYSRNTHFKTSINSGYAASGNAALEAENLLQKQHKIEEFQLKMDKAFEWLSKNTTGPWCWDECYDIQRGPFLKVYLHIERSQDQEYFQAVWGKDFKYIEHESEVKSNQYSLAIIRGVLPTPETATTLSEVYGGAGKWDIPQDFQDYLDGKVELDAVSRSYLKENQSNDSLQKPIPPKGS